MTTNCRQIYLILRSNLLLVNKSHHQIETIILYKLRLIGLLLLRACECTQTRVTKRHQTRAYKDRAQYEVPFLSADTPHIDYQQTNPTCGILQHNKASASPSCLPAIDTFGCYASSRVCNNHVLHSRYNVPALPRPSGATLNTQAANHLVPKHKNNPVLIMLAHSNYLMLLTVSIRQVLSHALIKSLQQTLRL